MRRSVKIWDENSNVRAKTKFPLRSPPYDSISKRTLFRYLVHVRWTNTRFCHSRGLHEAAGLAGTWVCANLVCLPPPIANFAWYCSNPLSKALTSGDPVELLLFLEFPPSWWTLALPSLSLFVSEDRSTPCRCWEKNKYKRVQTSLVSLFRYFMK